MYTSTNFKSKKAIKEAIANGQRIGVYSPGPFPCPTEGSITLEGPHYPKPHSWYATAKVSGGYIVPGSLK